MLTIHELDAFKNELAYVRQTKISGTTVSAMVWALAQIEGLQSENEKLRAAVKEALRVSGLNVLASKVVELNALANEGA